MPYPITLCGDQAEFEAQWAASGRPDSERPDWPLPSFDARDWSAAFCKIAKEHGHELDQGWMDTWFANAIMRGFDEHASRANAERDRLREVNADLLAVVRDFIEAVEDCDRRDEDLLWTTTTVALVARARAAKAKAETE